MISSIRIVAQEKVIKLFNISFVTPIVRHSPLVEISHQVLILAMNISEYLHWACNV
jgi:hypothetical protein